MNRKQRKQMEKSLGYTKRMAGMSKEELADVKMKKIMAGKQMTEKNLEDRLNKDIKEDEARDEKIIKSFMDNGRTLEEAKEILLKNKELQKKRIKK